MEMDAGIMDGRDLTVGAVSNIANPVQLARLVMDSSEHLMPIGEGALRFAECRGVERTPDHYFLTLERVAQLDEARLKHRFMLDHDDVEDAGEEQKYGIIGTGLYADNETCAVSTAGYGEDFMRTVIAKTISDAILFKGGSARGRRNRGYRLPATQGRRPR